MTVTIPNVSATLAPTTSAQETPRLSYVLKGTLTRRDEYFYPDPAPLAPTFTSTNVTQTVTLQSSPAVLPSAVPLGASIYHTTEVDDQPLETTTQQSDLYVGTNTDGGVTNDVAYGTSVISGGTTLPDTVLTIYGGAQIFDRRSTSGGDSTWTNDPSANITEDNGAAYATRVYAKDGSYVEQQRLPFAQSGTIVENSDGSGSYLTSLRTGWGYLSTSDPSSLDFSAPQAQPGSAATIAVSVAPFGPSPDTAAQQIKTFAPWYPLPLVLYSETDTLKHNASVPTTCISAPATATSVTRVSTSVDTVIGFIDTSTRTVFEDASGPICIALHDVLGTYYDYSGSQNGLIYNGILQGFTSVTFADQVVHRTTIDEVLIPSVTAATRSQRRRDVGSAVVVPAAVAAATEYHFLARVRQLHVAERPLPFHKGIK